MDTISIEHMAKIVSRKVRIPKQIKRWYDTDDKLQDSRELVHIFSTVAKNALEGSDDSRARQLIERIKTHCNTTTIEQKNIDQWIVARSVLALKDRLRAHDNIDSFGLSYKQFIIEGDQGDEILLNETYTDDANIYRYELYRDLHKIIDLYKWKKHVNKDLVATILKLHLLKGCNANDIAYLLKMAPWRVSRILHNYIFLAYYFAPEGTEETEHFLHPSKISRAVSRKNGSK